MSRNSYDDMLPEGYRGGRRGSGRTTAVIACIGVLLTLMAIFIYLLFSPSGEGDEPEAHRVDPVAAAPAEVSIIETDQDAALIEARPAPSVIEKASEDMAKAEFMQYTAAEGDTVSSIAEGFGLALVALAAIMVAVSLIYLLRAPLLSRLEVIGLGMMSGGAVGNNRDPDALAGTGRKRNRSANRLVGFPGINAELERNLGGLIEFHSRKFLEKSDRFRHTITLLRIVPLDLNLLLVKLTSTHRPPQFPCCARFLR